MVETFVDQHGQPIVVNIHRLLTASPAGDGLVELHLNDNTFVTVKATIEEIQGKMAAANSSPMRHLVLTDATGTVRRQQFEGREYVVVPTTALVEGVIWPGNAPRPELATAQAINVAPQGWNGRPIFFDHPVNGEGTQVSGNDPSVLETSIGRVFNSHVSEDGKRLQMELWIDEARAKAGSPAVQEMLQGLIEGKVNEVSVGAFVVARTEKGSFNGKTYDAVWQEIVPDHMAILPKGTEGACSVAAGCGTWRAAVRHKVSAEGISFQAELEGAKKRNFMTALADFLGLSDNDGLVTAKGARHSSQDLARVQAMHDNAVELGAQCMAPRMASAEGGNKETEMKREDKIKGLRTAIAAKCAPCLARLEQAAAKSKGDIVDAIVAQIVKKLGLSEDAAAAIADLPENVLVEMAGLEAVTEPPAEEKKDEVPPPPPAGYTGARAKTLDEYLADAPQEVKDLITDVKARDDARKAELIKTLKAVQTEYTEVELKTMSTKHIERIARACKANVPATSPIDFGVNTPRVNEGDNAAGAPAPIDMQARIRAARGIK